jgi:hypothetical protein
VGRHGTCCCCRPFDFTCVGSSRSESFTSRKPRYRKARFFRDQRHCPLKPHHTAGSHWTLVELQEDSAFRWHVGEVVYIDEISVSTFSGSSKRRDQAKHIQFSLCTMLFTDLETEVHQGRHTSTCFCDIVGLAQHVRERALLL